MTMNQRMNKFSAFTKADMKAKKEIKILLEESDKSEEKLSIPANESGIISVSFAIISTIFDKAAELLQKDGLVIKKPSANGNSFIVARVQIKYFASNLIKEVL